MEKRSKAKKRNADSLDLLLRRARIVVEQPEIADCSAPYRFLQKKLLSIVRDVERAFDRHDHLMGMDYLARGLARIHKEGGTRTDLEKRISESSPEIRRMLDPTGKAPECRELIEQLYERPQRYFVETMRSRLQDIAEQIGEKGCGRSAYMDRTTNAMKRHILQFKMMKSVAANGGWKIDRPPAKDGNESSS